MVCNLEIVSQTRKIQTQHKKTNTAHGGGGEGGEKKYTANHQNLKRKYHTHYTCIQTYVHTRTPKKTKIKKFNS